MQRGLPEPGEIIAEKYLVTGLIGRGGMGAVYVVEHRVTGKRLAVKCLLPEHSEQPELVERFLREAQAAGRIQHRNVVDVFDVGKDGELLYIVMELLDGKQLADLMRDQARPLDDMLAILLHAMEGVAAAHAHGIVHRDLKPENIMVCVGQSGRLDDPRVLDFGISKLEEDASLPLTRSGVMMGTPYYMSFEQINSQRDLDQRVDVYAMGVILYEVMSGQVPYVAESVGALAVQMMSGPPRPLAELRPDLPTGLLDVVMRAIAKERDERYPTMQALIDAVRPFVEQHMPSMHERARHSVPMTTPGRSSLRLSNGEAPTMRATPSPEGLRVSEADEGSRRPVQSDASPVMNISFIGAAVVLFGGLVVAMWPRGGGEPPVESEQVAPARVEAGATAPEATRPGDGAANVDAAVAQGVPADRPLPDASALLGDEELEEEPTLPGKPGRKKKVKKRGSLSLEQMVPPAPPPPETEREPVPADAASVAPAPVAPAPVAPAPVAPAPAKEEPAPREPAKEEPAPAPAAPAP